MDNDIYVAFNTAEKLRDLLIELAEPEGSDYRLTTSDRELLFHRRAEGIRLSLDELADIVQIMDGEWYDDRDNRTIDITTSEGNAYVITYANNRILDCTV